MRRRPAPRPTVRQLLLPNDLVRQRCDHELGPRIKTPSTRSSVASGGSWSCTLRAPTGGKLRSRAGS